MTDEELHQTKMECQPGSNYWEWATAEQEERKRAQQLRRQIAEPAAGASQSPPDNKRGAALRRVQSGLQAQLEEMRRLAPETELPLEAAHPVIALFDEVRKLLPELVPEFQYYARPTAFTPQIAHALNIVRDAISAEAPTTPVQSRAKSPNAFHTVFATYTVMKKIGEGGTGTVFDVFDEDGGHYALKVLKSSAVSKQRLKRFKNEIWFCSKNQHPNIISVLDWGFVESGGQQIPFYVMPLFKETLRGLMKKRIQHAGALRLFSDILAGIEVAHVQDVWHRDLKPENILYDPNADRVAIADFGIAHFSEHLLQTHIETDPNERLANFAYAAPEQCFQGRVDDRADVYSLGLILYEMFTGELLRGTGHKLIATVDQECAYLDAYVDRMVRQSRSDRPSIAELNRDFRRLNKTTTVSRSPKLVTTPPSATTSTLSKTLFNPVDPNTPILDCLGLGRIQSPDGLIAQTVAVVNKQDAAENKATNAKTKLEYYHPNAGLRIVESGGWLPRDDGSIPMAYLVSTDIPNEALYNVIYIVRSKDDLICCFPTAMELKRGPQIDVGRWRVLVTVTADNLNAPFQFGINFRISRDFRLADQNIVSESSHFPDWLFGKIDDSLQLATHGD